MITATGVTGAGPVPLRTAGPADNDALIALAAACPMEGDIGLCVDRAPDFFALNRLEGDSWEVAIAEGPDGGVDGCVALSTRNAYVRGSVQPIFYTGDLKVHPSRRGSEAADSLERWVVTRALEVDPDRPILLTILAGNTAMEKRMSGPRGLPQLEPFAMIRSHAIPLLHRRKRVIPGIRIAAAGPRDVEPMADLWGRVAPGRQLAPVLDAEGLAAWIEAAPGLHLHDYLLARDAGGRLLGFVGFWDQAPLKSLRVTGYSARMAAARAVINGCARLVAAAPVPPVGEPLPCRTAVHLCVPGHRPDVLRALVLEAYARWRGRYAVLLLGLDVRDPLAAGLRGLWAQPTDIHACLTAGSGRYAGPHLDDRPLHYETALV